MRGYLPAGLTVAAYAALLTAWRGAVEPVLPERPYRYQTARGEVFWSDAGGGPYYQLGDPHTAELLIVGGSRVPPAFPTDVLEETFGSAAIVWGPCAQLVDLLTLLPDFPARRVIVSLNPLTTYTEPALMAKLILGHGPPELAPGEGREELQALTEKVRALLVESGFPDADPVHAVAAWFGGHLRQRRDERATERVDRDLARWADGVRRGGVRTIETKAWRGSWFQPLRPAQMNPKFRDWLREETRAPRLEQLELLTGRLADLRGRGWDLSCVRIPISRPLYEIEEEALGAERLAQACEDAGVPYFDYTQGDDAQRGYATSDGSHVTVESGERFCRDFARAWLAARGTAARE